MCPQNPKSKRSLQIAAGEAVKKGKGEGAGFEAVCEECGRVFKSENGFKLHRTRNNGTKEGKCANKRKKIEEEQRNQEAQEAQQDLAPNFQGQDLQRMLYQSVLQETATNVESGLEMEDFIDYNQFE